MSNTFQFRLITTATLTATVEVEATSLSEARSKFIARDTRDFEWEVADPSALPVQATVTSVFDDQGTDVCAEEWHADERGHWHMPANVLNR